MTDEPRGNPRGIFCNRTLNLRAVKAIGYDMDYTLIHYQVEPWERRAFAYMKTVLGDQGWPVAALEFDPALVMRGLVIDAELGNVVKANRFGYVKRAFHGTKPLDFEAQRQIYSRLVVDLSEPRWVFLNTLFSLSEGCIYMQLVEMLDRGELAAQGASGMSYAELYKAVRRTADRAHLEGHLKAEIIAKPEAFVALDPETPLALLDQMKAGKKLMLITNSEWHYTKAMMGYAFDRFLPEGMSWRDLFTLVFVEARKPEFFAARMPLFEVVSDDGLLRPHFGTLKEGAVYLGGHARLVEEHLNLSGDELLYVGDHMFVDVHISKNILRWRTALVIRELEAEINATQAFAQEQKKLDALMREKTAIEREYAGLRLAEQRRRAGYGPPLPMPAAALDKRLEGCRQALAEIDQRISPLAQAAATVHNPHWGLLMHSGNDKSHMARQIERYADIYMSRVANFYAYTPFAYLRSPRGALPHDPE